jgi:hypothetical protein
VDAVRLQQRLKVPRTGASLCWAVLLTCAGLRSEPAWAQVADPAATASAGQPASAFGLPFHEYFSGDALLRAPTFDSSHQVLASGFLTALTTAEENAGYSDLEPGRLSLLGNSAQWTAWTLDGLQLTDPLFDGAEAFRVPWAVVASVSLLHAESARQEVSNGGPGFTLRPLVPASSMGKVTGTVGGIGGVFPLAPAIIGIFDGFPDHTSLPPVERQRIVQRFRAQLTDTRQVRGDLLVRWSVDAEQQTRLHSSFVGFGPATTGTPYDEPGARATLLTELQPTNQRWKAYVLAEYLSREHAFVERGFARPETQALRSGGLLFGLVTKDSHFGVTWKTYQTTAKEQNFSRELDDADGEGFFPYIPAGSMHALRVEGSTHWRDFYFRSDLRLLLWGPRDERQVHALTWHGEDAGRMEVASRATTTLIGDHRVGWARSWRFGWADVALNTGLALNHAQATELSLLVPGLIAKADLIAHATKSVQPFFSLALTPISPTSQLALTATPGYLAATQYVGPRVVQTFGGSSIRPATVLPPEALTLATGLKGQLPAQWTASAQVVAKAWLGLPRLALDGPADEFGHFTDGAYFFDRPTRYALLNTPLNQTPFGGTVQLEAQRADALGFFAVQFSAMSYVGWPPLGNGAWANDVGVVDFSSASPNVARTAFSVLDADRGYAFRMYGGRVWFDRLWTTFSVAYRDGQPFAWNAVAVEAGQVAQWGARPKGSPMHVGRPLLGWREPFQCIIDLQVSYELKVAAGWMARFQVAVANAFDLNTGTYERQGLGEDSRSTLATILPRTLFFGIELLEKPEPKPHIGG